MTVGGAEWGLDGANIEIREEVGAENFFLFCLTTEGIYALKSRGYNPCDYYNGNPQLKAVIDLISSGFFSHGDTNLFRPLVDSLLYHDPYLLFADYQSYIDAQEQVSQGRGNECILAGSVSETPQINMFA